MQEEQPPTPEGHKRLRGIWSDGFGHKLPAIFLRPPRIDYSVNQDGVPKYDVFFIGSLTRLPIRERLLHFEMVSAVQMLLQYEYNVNFSNAPLHTDSTLSAIPFADARNQLCYTLDTQSVMKAHFIVAELTHPSTGTGQEMECAANNGIPVIALVRRHSEGASWLSKISTYVNRITKFEFYLSNKDEPLAKKHLISGGSDVSPMVLGNPTIIKIIYYDAPNVLYQFAELAGLLASRSRFAGFMGRKILSGIYGGKSRISRMVSMHERQDDKNEPGTHVDDPISLLLVKLHEGIKKYAQLTPKSQLIDMQIGRLESSLKHNGKSPEDRAQMLTKLSILNEKRELLKRLREFNPPQRARDLIRLKVLFPENADNHSLVNNEVTFDDLILYRHKRIYEEAKAAVHSGKQKPQPQKEGRKKKQKAKQGKNAQGSSNPNQSISVPLSLQPLPRPAFFRSPTTGSIGMRAGPSILNQRSNL